MPSMVVVGGGTAGWLTAAYLSSRLNQVEGAPLQVTLIEASDIPPIGVGEATVPSIRDTMAAIGVHEYDFMHACDATFKHGIRFVQWRRPYLEAPDEYYFHPFERPLLVGSDSLAGYWLKGCDPYNRPFADAVSVQQIVSSESLAPKTFDEAPYRAPMPYAYHLDAGKLATFLKQVCLARGVHHQIGEVSAVNADSAGNIRSISLADGHTVAADVFIDCTGFSSLLIEKHYGEAFHSLTDILFCDRAVVCQRQYDNPLDPIRPFTLSTAQAAGWIWDIGLRGRRGTGYVYSSDYVSDDEALSTLRRYHGVDDDSLSFRRLNMRVGYRRRHWIGNCVALGLSGGFIEPLESTGIHLIELGLQMLVQMLPRFLNGGRPQDRFNEIMCNHYDICIDFVKLHYYLSQRTDTKFWRDNTAAASAPQELVEKVQAWSAGYPNVYDMRFVHSIFDHASYQYILFGMGKRPSIDPALGSHDIARATKVFSNVHDATVRARMLLPKHRSIIEAIHERATSGHGIAG